MPLDISRLQNPTSSLSSRRTSQTVSIRTESFCQKIIPSVVVQRFVRLSLLARFERHVDARVVIAHFEAEPVRVSGDKCSPARGESLFAAIGRVDRHPVAILARAESVGGGQPHSTGCTSPWSSPDP